MQHASCLAPIVAYEPTRHRHAAVRPALCAWERSPDPARTLRKIAARVVSLREAWEDGDLQLAFLITSALEENLACVIAAAEEASRT